MSNIWYDEFLESSKSLRNIVARCEESEDPRKLLGEAQTLFRQWNNRRPAYHHLIWNEEQAMLTQQICGSENPAYHARQLRWTLRSAVGAIKGQMNEARRDHPLGQRDRTRSRSPAHRKASAGAAAESSSAKRDQETRDKGQTGTMTYQKGKKTCSLEDVEKRETFLEKRGICTLCSKSGADWCWYPRGRPPCCRCMNKATKCSSSIDDGVRRTHRKRPGKERQTIPKAVSGVQGEEAGKRQTEESDSETEPISARERQIIPKAVSEDQGEEAGERQTGESDSETEPISARRSPSSLSLSSDDLDADRQLFGSQSQGHLRGTVVPKMEWTWQLEVDAGGDGDGE
ncbi:hypothetical protein H0H87_003600 [Tephrocybe sp. NHM501043]|nr:hypothetical protein H0H87_003600 [Tephrocybe sp. NHM501043]